MGYFLADQKKKINVGMDLLGFFPWPGWGHHAGSKLSALASPHST